MKRFLAIFLSIVVFCSVFSFMPVLAASNSQIRNQINNLEYKSSNLEAEIAELKGKKDKQTKVKNLLVAQITNIQEQINVCTDGLNKLNKKIAKSEAEIKAKEQTIKETKTLLKQRIRAIYMSGSTSSDVLLLLSSNSFSEFLTSRSLAKSISAKDEAVIKEINEAIKIIEESQEDIKKAIKEQNEAKAILDEKKAELRQKENQVNSVIYELSKDQSQLEADNKKLQAEIDRLTAEINAGMQQGGHQDIVYDGNGFAWPVPGYYNVTSEYGWRWGRMHKGLDISSGGIYGKPIVAAADGKVLVSGWSTGGYGYYVTINHGYKDGSYYTTLYAHMSRTACSSGQKVKQGQVIGYVGSTGDSTGPHLHFEIWKNGTPVNPRNYL